MAPFRLMSCRGAPWLLPWVAIAAAGCGDASRDREVGQTEFESAPPASAGGVGVDDGAGGSGNPDSGGNGRDAARTVEETDLYRLEGNRLYYLNGYRGLMVFDVQDVDHPKLLGRSPIFGQPIDMIVRDGVATVVIGDWYGVGDDGAPFHGSIVRGLDAKDPANIRVLGEAKLGGWVRDDRVVGDVIYAVSQDYGWSYGWGYGDVGVADGSVSSSNGASVIVSSVSFAGGKIQAIDRYDVPGFSGVFNVTPNAILLASSQDEKTQLRYLDISDPGGDIAARGTINIPGFVNGWGADNGRWNLDFADGKYAHAIAMNGARAGFVLSTVSFANPDAPTLASTLDIGGTGWAVAARFVGDRLYLSPDSSYYQSGSTPLQVYDLANPAAPRLAGSSQVAGTVWNLLPAPSNRLFALGNNYSSSGNVSLSYLDVANPAAPQLLGTSTFGDGWGWTPAAGTFKAFTLDAARGLAVLPYSGWDMYGARYRNGLQLVELTANALSTAGMAQTKGWVERGIFVGERLVSLSDLALSVIDYSNRQSPRVVNELTLARNVVATLPTDMGIAEVSSDWWDYDSSHSLIRMLPKAQAEESADVGAVPSLEIEGVNARVFANGHLLYVLTTLRCPGANAGCTQAAVQVQVVDFSGGAPVLRGKIALPNGSSDPWGWGWYGFWWYDWWGGDAVAQVEGDALALRKWIPKYDSSGNYNGSDSELIVLDFANADAPRVASTVVQSDAAGWWGNLKVVGSTLYSTEYEWVDSHDQRGGWVRYYLDAIDLSDRAHPRIKTHINVPGILVGGDASDPDVIYTMDYRWDGNVARNDFDVLRVRGHKASLLSHTRLNGWVGQSFVVGTTVYVSTQIYEENKAPRVELHAIDASKTSRPVDRVASDTGWGWLLAVVGDRALVTSGWGSSQAIDVYVLRDGKAPKFDQTVRSRGWSLNGVVRDGNALYLASGYWGVQRIAL